MPDPVESFIADFQRRRKRMFFNFGCSVVLFALGMAVALITAGNPASVGIQGWGLVAIALLLAGFIIAAIGFRQYRCPSCRQIFTGQDKYHLGVLIDPTHCPSCGVRLKP